MGNNTLKSDFFKIKDLELVGTTESIVKGGRGLFEHFPMSFWNTKKIGIIGWGSQGSAQAPCIRDSLAGTGLNVVVGLRENSSSWNKAIEAGFSDKTGTLDEMHSVIRTSDFVILLISDSAQVGLYKEIQSEMKSGATLGLSHGFLLGHMNNVGDTWREDINVIMVAPKGMGPSVRQLYLQGVETNGAGINCSIAIEQDYTGYASDLAISWAVAIGAPYMFQTTMEMEYKSDIFGERAVLLGGVWALVERLFRKFHAEGMSASDAFINSVESITGPISQFISDNGLLGILDLFSAPEKDIFQQAYEEYYSISYHIMYEIYSSVSSGKELHEVIARGENLDLNPMDSVDEHSMWKIGKSVRAKRIESQIPLNPYSAGAYVAMIMAQVDLLVSKGHCWSEIANESIIEATDSLNPYMHKNGVAYMIDNCSVTAKLGARKWGPIFKEYFRSDFDSSSDDLLSKFKNNPIHEVLIKVGHMRPTVKISL